jgi:uncharacterized protein DUF5658
MFSVAALVAVVSPLAAQDGAMVEPQRPALLIPLYATNVALHGLDLWTTKRALDAGNREGNPLFKDASIGAMTGAKIAASAATILIAEKLWKRNRIAAVGLMLATNVGLSAVAANNYRVTQRTRPGP